MFIFLLLLTVLTATPILYNTIYILFLWLLFLCFFGMPWKDKTNKTLKRIWSYSVVYMFISLFYVMIGISQVKMGYCFASFTYFFPILGLMAVDSHLNFSQVKLLFYAVVLIIALNILDSIRISILNPGVLYQSLNDGFELIGETKQNVGGAMFVNMVLFYINLMMIAIYNTAKKGERLFFVICLVIAVIFIVGFSLKASAVLLAVVSILAQIIAHKGQKNMRAIIITGVALLSLIVLFRDEIIFLIIDIVGSDRLASRLLLFVSDSNSMSSGDDSSLTARIDLWIVSLETWLSSPISFLFGIGDRNPHDFSSFAASGIGYHSDFTDVFARYGLIGAYIFFKTLVLLYKYLKLRYGSEFYYEILVYFILIILMGVTKRFVSGEPALTIMFVFPLCLRYLSWSRATHK